MYGILLGIGLNRQWQGSVFSVQETQVVALESGHAPDRDPETVGLDIGVCIAPDDLVVGRHLEDIASIGLGDQGIAVGKALCAAAEAGEKAPFWGVAPDDLEG